MTDTTTDDDLYAEPLRVFHATYAGVQCTEGSWMPAFRAAIDEAEAAARARVVDEIRQLATDNPNWAERDAVLFVAAHIEGTDG